MTWKRFVLELAQQFCDEQGSRTFLLREFIGFAQEPMKTFAPNNLHREEKLRQTLQFLRNDSLITFVDGFGTYTLRTDLLKGEVEPEVESIIRQFKGPPSKREYLIEVYARNRGWVKKARDTFGVYCLCDGCNNTFLKEDGTPYCEVHHIVPLCEDGEEALNNLAVLCAHHHRMAHFAALSQRSEIRDFLKDRTQQILTTCHPAL